MSDYPSITLEKYINIDGYDIDKDPRDPGKRDIGFLVYVAQSIPRKPSDILKIDPGVLASLCLSAHADACTYYSEALMWQRMKEIKMASELARAINDINVVTNADKKAKKDDIYMKAAELAAKGEAISKFYEGVKNNFDMGHYWAKEKEKSDGQERKSSGYEPHILKTGEGIVPEKQEATSSDFKF